MNLSEFLTTHSDNGKFSKPDENFLSEINKKSTKYLLFYNQNCPKSTFLLQNLPKSSRILKVDLSSSWAQETFKVFEGSRIPSLVIVKNGSMVAEKVMEFNESRAFLSSL